MSGDLRCCCGRTEGHTLYIYVIHAASKENRLLIFCGSCQPTAGFVVQETLK